MVAPLTWPLDQLIQNPVKIASSDITFVMALLIAIDQFLNTRADVSLLNDRHPAPGPLRCVKLPEDGLDNMQTWLLD